MPALARIGVFVQMSAIKFRQAVRISRKVGRRPIQNDADTRLMEAVDERHEIVWRAVTAGSGKISERLVSPGTVERMLHHRHQFHVRVAHLLQIGNELVGQFRIRKPAVSVLDDAPPGTKMNFIDRDGRGQPIVSGAPVDPARDRSSVAIEPRDDRSGLGPHFRAESVRIALQYGKRRTAAEFHICRSRPRPVPGQRIPIRRTVRDCAWVRAPVPLIEISHNADAHRVGRPHAELNSGDAIDRPPDALPFFRISGNGCPHPLDTDRNRKAAGETRRYREFPDRMAVFGDPPAVTPCRKSAATEKGAGQPRKTFRGDAPGGNRVGAAVQKDGACVARGKEATNDQALFFVLLYDVRTK